MNFYDLETQIKILFDVAVEHLSKISENTIEDIFTEKHASFCLICFFHFYRKVFFFIEFQRFRFILREIVS